jgi:hypothetical protein
MANVTLLFFRTFELNLINLLKGPNLLYFDVIKNTEKYYCNVLKIHSIQFLSFLSGFSANSCENSVLKLG